MNPHTTRHTGRTAAAALAIGAALLASGCRLPDPSAAASADPGPAGLTVAPEDTGAHYDRDDWPHWSYHGRGCNTRELVLQQQGSGVEVGKGCKPVAGTWTSRYDGATVTDPETLDVDHVVPLAEAARSGARTWSEAERERYANDPAVLVVVTARSNRAKGDQDPAEWLPDRDRCGYVRQWTETKRRYALTADPAEAEAIRAVLSRCGGDGR
ncbi:hypothetical protein BAY59_29225 [Prauserella coralliicola]|nr:hypothetical protein BAY59_29225 [Prauserella coralliicola]